jgi:hypothetical protein
LNFDGEQNGNQYGSSDWDCLWCDDVCFGCHHDFREDQRNDFDWGWIMKYHKDMTTPENGEIFVFGSNLAGIHGAGAAREAQLRFGAVRGLGRGLVGQSLAIPTKDEYIRSLSFDKVRGHINDFVNASLANPHIQFWVTRVGCGLAGFDDKDIAPLFKRCGSNCNMPEPWRKYLEK